MSVLADTNIRARNFIKPFYSGTGMDGSRKIISRGVSSYGYDISIDGEVLQLTNTAHSMFTDAVIDPKCGETMQEALQRLPVAVDASGTFVVMPPHSFCLAKSVERMKIPADVIGVCVGKSTYARCGIVLNVTPLEPEWEGIITLELSNTTDRKVRVYTNEGIGQILFFKGSVLCDCTYEGKKGKYQHQEGITLPKA